MVTNVAEDKSRLPRWVIPFALVLVGLALGVVVSWPLPKYFTTAVPYTMSATPDTRTVGMIEGDHLQYIYHLGQLRLAVEGHAPWFRNTYEFAGPYGFREFYLYFPTALLYWPLSYVSHAFAFNTIIMLSFVGTMVAGYGLARAWGANRAGAFCAAVVLTLFPARLTALYGGHPAGSAFFLFPMAWWGLEKSWERGRAGWGWLAAACLVPLARLDPHYLFFFCFLLPFWAFWKLADAGTFAARQAAPSSRTHRLVDALPPLVAALIAAACVHYNQIRLHAIEGVGLQVVALAAFFLLVIFAIRWLIARLVDWLGVADEPFRRLWLAVPWFTFWLLAFYFLAGLVEKEQFGLHLVRACVRWFLVAQIAFLGVAAHRKLLHPGRIRVPWRRIVKMWPAFIGLAIAVGYEMYLKLAVIDVSGVKGGRTLHEVRLFSVPFDELFQAARGNGAFVGWFLTFLVLVHTIAFARKRAAAADTRRVEKRFLIAAALFFLGMVLTTGPLLSAYFPLYEALYRLVPFFGFTRATVKYAILTATFGSAALALVLTIHSSRARRALIGRACALLLLVACPLAFAIGYARIVNVGVSRLPDDNATYAYVAAHSQGAPLLELPIWPGDSAHSAIYQYWTLRTHVPTINGYSPTVPAGYIERISWPLYDLNYGRLGPREAKLCREIGVRYINFHEEAFPRKVSEFPATTSLKMLRLNPNLRLVADDGPIHLFEMLDEAPTRLEPAQLPFLSRYVPIDELKKQVGHEVADADALDGRAWASDGRRGRLFFGPFAVLPSGDYVAVFRIKAHAENPADTIGTLDIYAKRDKTPAPKEPLVVHALTGADWNETGGYRFVEVPFTLGGAQVVETRGWFDGARGTSLAVDCVFIQSKPAGATIRIEAEDMFHTSARLVEDAAASQGFLLEFDNPPPDATGRRLDERFVLLDPGPYRLEWRANSGIVEIRRVTRDGFETAATALISRNEEERGLVTAVSRFEVPQRGVYAVTGYGRLDRADYIELAPAGAADSPEDGATSTTPSSTARSARGN